MAPFMLFRMERAVLDSRIIPGGLMSGYLNGLLLGLALIVPIGPQNIIVLDQDIPVACPSHCSPPPSWDCPIVC